MAYRKGNSWRYPHDGVYAAKKPWMACVFGGYPHDGVYAAKKPWMAYVFGGCLVALLLVMACAAVVGAVPPRRAVSGEPEDGVLLQGFGWNSQNGGVPSRWYQLLGDRAQDIADLGITMVWFPPVSRSVSPQGYLPGDYYDLGSPNAPTFYGNQEQLVQSLKKLHDVGVKNIADIVINHRCAGAQDHNGLWNIFRFPSGKAAWECPAVVKGEYGGTGDADTGDNYQPAPDLDHTNAKVQADIAAWMKWLKVVGFDGWRYDFSKGYGPRFTEIYDQKTSPCFSVGEIWTDMSFSGSQLNYDQNAHRQVLCNWLDKAGKKVAVFDFTTKGILQVAVQGEYGRLRDAQGKAAGLIGWWPQRAVTFLDNHDTGSQQGHWPFPGDKVMQGYAYILTHPGIPCVFWEHVYDWKLRNQVKKLIDIRRNFGLNSAGKLEILKAENGLYAAIIDGKVAVKLGAGDWSPDASFKLLTSGERFAVWGKDVKAGRSR